MNSVRDSWIVHLCYFFAGLELGFTQETGKKQLHLQGLQPMSGKAWVGGAACVPAALLALRHVNEKSGLLDGYNLTYSWVDTQCNAGLATFKMFETLQEPPSKIMILGCGCSTESEATAQVSHLFNVTQLSYGSSSPILSDRKRFPNFFRLAGPDQKLNPAKVALMTEFDWRKVATINQALEFFSVVIDDFVKSVKGTEITIISQEIFEHDPLTRVENLKKHDARIIITACYEDKARLLLCHAYKVGLYGPKVVWMFNGWYSSEFWRQNLDDVPCTVEEMELSAERAFVLGFYYKNPLPEKGIANLTVSEFEVLYRLEETYDPSMSMYDIVSGTCYDHIWVAAIALNCTDAYLKSIGYSKSIDEFTYQDSIINDVVLDCMSNISLTGVSGNIVFGEGADPIRNVRIEQIQDRQRRAVGTYFMSKEPMLLKWNEVGIKWKGGHIPRDSTYVSYEEVSIPLTLYAVITSLSCIGILFAVACFVFNIIHRDNKIVKLSSPNINNVLLIGCVMTYTVVFMRTTDMATSDVCKARTFCFSIGFTISFGALFSKTWRVYKIFTNKKLMKVSIKDYQLIGIVCAMSGVIVFILVVWEIIGPQQLIRKELTQEVYKSGNDAEVRPFVRVCHSDYSVYFEWTVYIIEGGLLAFGAFLSWETRHVKIEALNDSHQIGMCLYNVVVLSAVALTLTLLLDEKVVMMYGVTSGCIVIGTTTTQLLVFAPKMIAVYHNTTIESISVQPFGSGSGSRFPQSQISSTATPLTPVDPSGFCNPVQSSDV